MSEASKKRDYSITGPEKAKAIAGGLASADWYQCPIPRKRLRELMARRNGPPARDTILWLALMIAAGYVACLSWGTWWALPAFLAYGTIYSVGATSRWHEFSHGTPFRIAWLNEAMYQVCACLIWSQGTNFRWSHVRHHTDTYIVGRDPEIMEPRPPAWKKFIHYIVQLKSLYGVVKTIVWHALGRVNEAERELIPEREFRKLFWEGRALLVVYAAVVTLSVVTHSWLPVMLVGLPAFYGSWLMIALNSTQHLGLYEDTTDHRLCCRTFYTNRLLRFLYSEMNYHVEHHMFPMVPYYNLHLLHAEIKADCPAAAPSFLFALRETWIALWRERKNPNYIVPRHKAFAEAVRAARQ